MNAFTNGLKTAGGGISDGVGGIASGVSSGVGTLTGQGRTKPEDAKDPAAPTNIANASNSTQIDNSDQPPASEGTAQPQQGGGGFLGSVTGGVASGFSAVGGGVVAVGKSGGALVTGAAQAGANIGQTVGQAGLDLTQNVVGGVADLTGTVLGGVVDAAAQTSGAVFEPVGAGLKTLEGLQHIGPGIEFINGLPMGAVRELATLTTKALNMSGKTPTFFDPNADGIVGIPDTTKGLILLGLDESTAGYAALALHGVFSYPTSDSWVPSADTTMPIHVASMHKTRWGKNWGNFERLDWVEDVNIDDVSSVAGSFWAGFNLGRLQFFADTAEKKTYAEYWKQSCVSSSPLFFSFLVRQLLIRLDSVCSRQYFGILLLIFEWGTTWPFYMPDVPIAQIPFSDELGTVVRKAVLPTILANFQRARDVDPEAKNKSGGPPSKEAPDDPKDA
ncbi:hypothetical protein FIBSPDRAFT_865791 [Athelia psychrophila]|uniref:Uncharacterized protein n=1 Tax=Athelia psychrophila TaxID=1759441 RepID=A0A166FC10_9AGAM|nr:hypothetical protein FIBSPDRAFT_865791 [Fibularhizoctonia sp. CBS 109695]